MDVDTARGFDKYICVTVVICTRNRPLLLERCLQWLEQVDHPDFSILVVDSRPKSSEAMIPAN
jgi:hypothetical protein